MLVTIDVVEASGGTLGTIDILGPRTPSSPRVAPTTLKLLVAEETGADITLLRAILGDAPKERRETVRQYHDGPISILSVTARSSIIEADDEVASLARFAGPADLLVTGVDRTGLSGRVLGRPSDRLVDSVDCTAVMVRTRDGTRRNVLERLLMDYLLS